MTDKIMELKKSVVEILQEDDIEQNLNLFELDVTVKVNTEVTL